MAEINASRVRDDPCQDYWPCAVVLENLSQLSDRWPGSASCGLTTATKGRSPTWLRLDCEQEPDMVAACAEYLLPAVSGAREFHRDLVPGRTQHSAGVFRS